MNTNHLATVSDRLEHMGRIGGDDPADLDDGTQNPEAGQAPDDAELTFEAHRAADPHCTCNDCVAFHSGEGDADADVYVCPYCSSTRCPGDCPDYYAAMAENEADEREDRDFYSWREVGL